MTAFKKKKLYKKMGLVKFSYNVKKYQHYKSVNTVYKLNKVNKLWDDNLNDVIEQFYSFKIGENHYEILQKHDRDNNKYNILRRIEDDKIGLIFNRPFLWYSYFKDMVLNGVIKMKKIDDSFYSLKQFLFMPEIIIYLLLKKQSYFEKNKNYPKKFLEKAGDIQNSTKKYFQVENNTFRQILKNINNSNINVYWLDSGVYFNIMPVTYLGEKIIKFKNFYEIVCNPEKMDFYKKKVITFDKSNNVLNKKIYYKLRDKDKIFVFNEEKNKVACLVCKKYFPFRDLNNCNNLFDHNIIDSILPNKYFTDQKLEHYLNKFTDNEDKLYHEILKCLKIKWVCINRPFMIERLDVNRKEKIFYMDQMEFNTFY